MRHRGWQNNEIAEFQRMPSALRKRFTVLIPLCAKVDICARSVFIFLIIIIFFFFFWGPAAQHTPPIFETNSDPSVFRWQQGAGFLSFVAGPKSILSHLTRKSHYRTLSTFSFHCAHPRLIWSHRTFGPSLLGFGLQVDRLVGRNRAQMQSKLVQTEIRIAAGHQLHQLNVQFLQVPAWSSPKKQRTMPSPSRLFCR